MHFWNNPIHPLLSAVLSTWTEPKTFLEEITFWTRYMHGLKSATFGIFEKGLGWPCPVRATLKKHHSIWKIIFVFGADEHLERLEGKIRKCLFFYVKIF
jgi:hypothetical protein